MEKRLPSEFARDQGSADLAGALGAFSPQVSLARAPSCKEESAQEKTDPSSDRVSLSLPFPWNMGYEKKSQITQWRKKPVQQEGYISNDLKDNSPIFPNHGTDALSTSFT